MEKSKVYFTKEITPDKMGGHRKQSGDKHQGQNS